VLITTDPRFALQQDVSRMSLAAVILVARRNKLEFLLPLAPELKKILVEVRRGEVRHVGG
jgi:hypothetical protein